MTQDHERARSRRARRERARERDAARAPASSRSRSAPSDRRYVAAHDRGSVSAAPHRARTSMRRCSTSCRRFSPSIARRTRRLRAPARPWTTARTIPGWLARARPARAGARERACSSSLLGFLIVFSSAQIVLRNVFSIGVTWGDGLTRSSCSGSRCSVRSRRAATGGTSRMNALRAVAAAEAPARHGRRLGLVRRRRKRARSLISRSSSCATRASYGDLLLGQFPAWWFESIMPVAFALIAYRFVLHALGRKRGS